MKRATANVSLQPNCCSPIARCESLVNDPRTDGMVPFRLMFQSAKCPKGDMSAGIRRYCCECNVWQERAMLVTKEGRTAIPYAGVLQE